MIAVNETSSTGLSPQKLGETSSISLSLKFPVMILPIDTFVADATTTGYC
jgi:hypothetical protein